MSIRGLLSLNEVKAGTIICLCRTSKAYVSPALWTLCTILAFFQTAIAKGLSAAQHLLALTICKKRVLWKRGSTSPQSYILLIYSWSCSRVNLDVPLTHINVWRHVRHTLRGSTNLAIPTLIWQTQIRLFIVTQGRHHFAANTSSSHIELLCQ